NLMSFWPRAAISCLFVVFSLTLDSQAADEFDSAPLKRAPVKLPDAALRIHREALVIDGHNDLAWKFREKSDPFFRRLDIAKKQSELHNHIPRLRQRAR